MLERLNRYFRFQTHMRNSFYHRDNFPGKPESALSENISFEDIFSAGKKVWKCHFNEIYFLSLILYVRVYEISSYKHRSHMYLQIQMSVYSYVCMCAVESSYCPLMWIIYMLRNTYIVLTKFLTHFPVKSAINLELRKFVRDWDLPDQRRYR